MAQNPVTGAPIRLVVTDEDGTFLDLGGEDFSRERFSAVFARMRADGCRFAVATSNQSFQVKDVFGPLAPRVALATSNGAYVEAEGRRLRVSVAPDGAVERVLAAHAAHPEIPLCTVCADGAWVEPGTDPDFVAEMTVYSHGMGRVESLADPRARQDVLMFWSRVPEGELARSIAVMREALGGAMDVVDSGCEDGWGYFDVVQRGVSKATGVRVLMEHWKISPEEVVAFGDAGNDVEMLRLAGAGYAMGNADEAVRAAADLVCAPCREQGVLRVLEQLWPV